MPVRLRRERLLSVCPPSLRGAWTRLRSGPGITICRNIRRILLPLTCLRLLMVMTALLSACIESPTPAVVSCQADGDCPSGQCLAGLCVPVVDTAAADTAAADAGPDGGKDAAPDSAKCTEDEQCVGGLGDLGDCAVARCIEGACQTVPLPAETTCLTAELCPYAGVCNGLGACGNVKPGAEKCDDGNPCTLFVACCTTDACPVKGCVLKPLTGGACPTGQPCLTGTCEAGACSATIKSNACLIEGSCHANDEAGPGTPCARCRPKDSQIAWTPLTTGPCQDGNACTSGDVCGLDGGCSGAVITCPGGTPCQEPACDATLGCGGTPVPGPCTDGDPCTLGDTCKNGTCTPSVAVTCDDGNPCTDDICNPGIGCLHKAASTPVPCIADTDPCTLDICEGGGCVAKMLLSVCKIGGSCVPAGGKADSNPCLVCEPGKDPNGWTVVSGGACNDGNACTSGDVCHNGACEGEPAACDDKNLCTKNSCTPDAGCVFTATQSACDDFNLCTKSDTCVQGKCVGTLLGIATCADENPCTEDSCAPAFGCTHTPNKAECSDGDPCTKNDICNAGNCIAGGVICPCETDADCNDANPCSSDKCEPGKGCVNAALGSGDVCNDGNACTGQDACGGGLCLGVVKACDDGNPCTLDGCVAEEGCTALALQGMPCNDANACTSGDLCLNGACGGTAKNCDDGNPCTTDGCDPKKGGCEHDNAADGTPCPNDGIACTVDKCVVGTCNHASIASGFCHIEGACLSGGAVHPAEPCLGCLPLKSQGKWSPRTNLPCNDGDACTTQDLCLASLVCAGTAMICDDNNPCTKNGCNSLAPGPPCLFVPAAGACQDGNVCTTGDGCNAGTCTGAPVVCNDNDPCTTEACKPGIGCVDTPVVDGTTCADDGLDCTYNVCIAGSCEHPVESVACVIAGVCYDAGQAAKDTPCLACKPLQIQDSWSPVTGSPCNDDDVCTSGDLCASGTCSGTPDKACDDGNPCTQDSCSKAIGCSQAPATGPCDDGNACTSGDSCDGSGGCSPGKPKTCGATKSGGAGTCTAALCDPLVGCSEVSTCGPLHQCLGGLCVTVSQPGQAGPAQVPLKPTAVPQPLVPTLRWQETHTGPTGSIPQLWLSAQTKGCAPAFGVYSDLVTLVLPPGAVQPVFVDVPAQKPPGQPGWCSVHPILAAHPTTYQHLVLAWTEGGNAASPCPIDSSRGQVRLALVGVGGKGILLGGWGSCTGPTGLGLPMRPMLSLLQMPGGMADQPGGLGGLLVRAGANGGLAWQGGWLQAWGGTGKSLPIGSLPDTTASALSSRPVRSEWTDGALLFSLSQHKAAGKDPVSAVDATKIAPDGTPASTAKALIVAADLPGTQHAWHAVEAAWDPDVGRVGLLLSGTVVQNGETKGVLAFARVTPDQALPGKPSVLQLFTPPDGFAGTVVLHAFRLAQLPGTGDFLVLWAWPGSKALNLARVQPLDDKQFFIQSIATVATNYVGYAAGTPVPSSGGLSELVVSPDGQRVSVAYESVGALYLLTMAVPK